MPKQPNNNRVTPVCMWADYIWVFVSPSLIWPRLKKAADTAAARNLAVALFVHMHKGCTRDAHGTNTPAVPCRQEGGKTGCLTGSGSSPHAQGDTPRRSAVAAVSKHAPSKMVNS